MSFSFQWLLVWLLLFHGCALSIKLFLPPRKKKKEIDKPVLFKVNGHTAKIAFHKSHSTERLKKSVKTHLVNTNLVNKLEMRRPILQRAGVHPCSRQQNVVITRPNACSSVPRVVHVTCSPRLQPVPIRSSSMSVPCEASHSFTPRIDCKTLELLFSNLLPFVENARLSSVRRYHRTTNMRSVTGTLKHVKSSVARSGVSCCGGLAVMAQEANFWDPGSIPGRNTSFDVPESSCFLSGPGFQLDSRYTGSRGWFGGSSGTLSAGEEDGVTGTLKHVKSSVARSGGIVLRWSSGYGAGGQFLRPGFDPRSRHIFWRPWIFLSPLWPLTPTGFPLHAPKTLRKDKGGEIRCQCRTYWARQASCRLTFSCSFECSCLRLTLPSIRAKQRPPPEWPEYVPCVNLALQSQNEAEAPAKHRIYRIRVLSLSLLSFFCHFYFFRNKQGQPPPSSGHARILANADIYGRSRMLAAFFLNFSDPFLLNRKHVCVWMLTSTDVHSSITGAIWDWMATQAPPCGVCRSTHVVLWMLVS